MANSGFEAFDSRSAAPGKYRPFRRLAVGGMAEIFLAYARSIHGFEKLVVLKRVLPAYAENREFMRMFLDEARLAATLDHPNIVHVYDIGEHGGNFFFAMEYVHGQSLLKLMRQITNARRWLPLEHALGIIIGTCAGMHYAHEKNGLDGRALGIVHRDVSPPNILISYDGSVKVADFGIAKASIATTSTAVGTLKGKIPYMSPEQCRSGPLDRRSDIFSIGILLYELTVGRRLFQAESELGIIHKIVNGVIPPPSQLLRGYPEDLERIVYRALQLDPEHRYPTARALQVDLEELAREYKLPISSVRLASFMEEMFDEETRRWPSDPAHAAGRPSTEVASATDTGGFDLPGGPGSNRAGGPAPTMQYGGQGRPPVPQGRMPTGPQQTVAPQAMAPQAPGPQPRPNTGGHPTVDAGATPQDFEAIERALARMLESDADVGNLTEGIGESTGDGWSGLDSLELEDLFPAKRREK
ncbi:MAG: protein kinase [Myxococcales bacterium]|nr:protein kinase [Myxococcales bacterium]